MKGFGDQRNSKKKNVSNKNTKSSKEIIINQAIKFHLEGNILEAEKYYQHFINQGFKDHRAFSNYGGILKTQGRLQEAESSLRKAIELKPDFADAHNNLGIILKTQCKLQEAESSLRKAIELKPDDAMAYSNLGSVLRDLGKLQEAEIFCTKAIELNPGFADGHNNLGNILRDLGKLQEAEKSYTKAVELKPDDAMACSNLGNVLRDLGKLQEAESSTRKAIKLKPDFAMAYSNLGNVLRDLGKLQEAEKSYTKAIKLKPSFANAAWNLYCLANSLDEAEKRIKQCLKIDENFLEAKLTLCALKFYQGDHSIFDELINSTHKNHPYMRSFKWTLALPKLPKLFFHRWALFDSMIQKSKKDRPFYEFGVWRGNSFKYLLKSFNKGYGFDTFEGLPEDWHTKKQGSYSAEGIVPNIDNATFIEGKFEDTLPIFFSKSRPIASIINFDADLYSSTLCALNYSKNVIDQDTILIFDEFIINKNWEKDEYKALNEFCSVNNCSYEVIAISYVTKQVAVKIINL